MSVGGTLAAARAARGLTVEEVSASTRIRPHLIRAMEAENFDVCGGDVYARGHVRALAKALAIDPDPLLAELAATGRAAPPPLRAPANDPSLVLRERRATPSWMTAAAVLLGVVACLAGLRLVLPSGSSQDADSAAPTPRATATATATASPSLAAAGASPPTKTSGSGALAVSFAVTGDRCWVAVKDSEGATRLASVLTEGQTATFRDDRKLSVVVGDVRAVTVTVNGQQVDLGNSQGFVKRFVVRASDPLAAFGEPNTIVEGTRSPAA